MRDAVATGDSSRNALEAQLARAAKDLAAGQARERQLTTQVAALENTNALLQANFKHTAANGKPDEAATLAPPELTDHSLDVPRGARCVLEVEARGTAPWSLESLRAWEASIVASYTSHLHVIQDRLKQGELRSAATLQELRAQQLLVDERQAQADELNTLLRAKEEEVRNVRDEGEQMRKDLEAKINLLSDHIATMSDQIMDTSDALATLQSLRVCCPRCGRWAPIGTLALLEEGVQSCAGCHGEVIRPPEE